MKKFSQFVEAVGKTAVFTFGRFNPPTIGHQKLLQATTRVARKRVVKHISLVVTHRIKRRIL